MGLLDSLFKKPKDVQGIGYKTFTDIAPVFTSYDGGIYQQELTRAAISRFATACSKLKPEIEGNSKPHINKLFQTSPNEYMTWPKFLARLATIYECDSTAYIVPGFSRDMTRIVGLFPLKCEFAEVVEFQGIPWIRFHFASGDTSAIELENVCIISKFQYKSDLFGEPNCLQNTMQLIHAQNEAQNSAIKNGAKIRFIGSLTGQVREEDMKKKRERFVADNLGPDNESGLLLYDQTFSDVKQIQPQSYTIDAQEMARIEESVLTYFATSKAILQNSFKEDDWAAYYEGKIEPWAIQVGEGLNKMLFTQREQATNKISFSSSRLAYASNASKRNMIRDMLDRGVFTINEAREILQLPKVPDGDIRVIRGEYLNADAISTVMGNDDAAEGKQVVTPKLKDDNDPNPGDEDDIYKDSDNDTEGD